MHILEGQNHPAIIPALADRMLHDPKPITRYNAAVHLTARKDPASIDPFIQSLRDPDGLVAKAALEALFEFGPNPQVQAALQDALHHPMPHVAEVAVYRF